MAENFKTSPRIEAFLSEYLPEALNAETSFAALTMLYELIDAKGLDAPKYEKLNEFGLIADEIYDEILELNTLEV